MYVHYLLFSNLSPFTLVIGHRTSPCRFTHTHTHTHTLSLNLDPSARRILVYNTFRLASAKGIETIPRILVPRFFPFRSRAASSPLYAVTNRSRAVGATRAQHGFPSSASFKRLTRSQRILFNDVQAARAEPTNCVNGSEDNNSRCPFPVYSPARSRLGNAARVLYFFSLSISNSRADPPSAIYYARTSSCLAPQPDSSLGCGIQESALLRFIEACFAASKPNPKLASRRRRSCK